MINLKMNFKSGLNGDQTVPLLRFIYKMRFCIDIIISIYIYIFKEMGNLSMHIKICVVKMNYE